jgi:hypothetical protein
MSVEISICFVASGATPIAIASAIIPSMRPVDLRLLGLRFPASSSVIAGLEFKETRQACRHSNDTIFTQTLV